MLIFGADGILFLLFSEHFSLICFTTDLLTGIEGKVLREGLRGVELFVV